MIYGCVTDNSLDNRDALHCLLKTSGYSSVTTLSAAERPPDKPGQHRDASGHLKDTPHGFTDLADTHGWGFIDLYFSRGCQLIDKDILLT